MNTIINKKGNSGFTAQPYNCSHAYYMDNGKKVETLSYSPRTDETEFKVQYVVRPVTVNSCGKKQMTLEAHDSKWSNMRGNFYNPETPIYVTSDDAEDYIRQDFETIGREGVIRSLRRLAKMKQEWLDEYPQSKQQYRQKAVNEMNKYIDWANRAEAGEDILEIVYY